MIRMHSLTQPIQIDSARSCDVPLGSGFVPCWSFGSLPLCLRTSRVWLSVSCWECWAERGQLTQMHTCQNVEETEWLLRVCDDQGSSWLAYMIKVSKTQIPKWKRWWPVHLWNCIQRNNFRLCTAVRNCGLLLAHPWNWNKRVWSKYAQYSSWHWFWISQVTCTRSILEKRGCNLQSGLQHDRIACSFWFDFCNLTILAGFCRKLCSNLLLIVPIWKLRSFWPVCTLKLRHLCFQPYREALRRCPRTLPFETLKHHALWILLCILLRLWRWPLEHNKRNWLVYKAMMKASHIPFFVDVVHMLSPHARACSCICLNLTVPHWHQLKMHLPEVSLGCFVSQCTAKQAQYLFFHFQTSIRNLFEVIIVVSPYLVVSSVAACCLQFGTFYCLLYDVFHLFLGWCYPSFRPYTIWPGSVLDVRRSAIYPLVSFKKPCT